MGQRLISLRQVWLDEIRSWRVSTSVKPNRRILFCALLTNLHPDSIEDRHPALLRDKIAAMAEANTHYPEHMQSEYMFDLTLPLPISHLCKNYLPLPNSHLCEIHMCTCMGQRHRQVTSHNCDSKPALGVRVNVSCLLGKPINYYCVVIIIIWFSLTGLNM